MGALGICQVCSSSAGLEAPLKHRGSVCVCRGVGVGGRYVRGGSFTTCQAPSQPRLQSESLRPSRVSLTEPR